MDGTDGTGGSVPTYEILVYPLWTNKKVRWLTWYVTAFDGVGCEVPHGNAGNPRNSAAEV